MNKPVTLWYVFDNEKNKWIYNHLENGHFIGKPFPKSDAQKGWLKQSWAAKHQFIDDEYKVIGHG